MKVNIGNYYLDKKTEDQLNAAGLHHNESFNVSDPFEIIEKIYRETKLNIMVLRHNEDMIIYVSYKSRFTQR